ncbi:acyl-CoA dehydratase activase [Megasphaera cerevisiae]|jgi:predicted CoA-substrate-specific enzyme activase|uniref:acyl-CoA dehydratase activase n=1 Tax=Megasphaera cerevisiae TaxID=39029 RepID=UPI000944A46C|nr:acyl-CoA dehydratase activase [Megasphaera cerevisiae]OKY54392.1 CoA activase [Megasphaera cerevisiae]
MMKQIWYIGIDMGSTAAKIVAVGDHELRFVMPTGWSCLDTAGQILKKLKNQGILPENSRIVSTGYGRQAVSYADKAVTEITCHAAGCAQQYPDCTIIDVGGQDTKAIHVCSAVVDDFIMNDKCSAGTGKFIEIMANRLGCTIDTLFSLAAKGRPVNISSLCTVFAESEIIGHISKGKARENIAAGIVRSVAIKVAQLAQQVPVTGPVLLTGGLSHLPYFAAALGKELQCVVRSAPQGRYAGAYGAAVLAKKVSQ